MNEFTDHINSLDNNIKFTREEEGDGTLPFLDTLIVREECGSIKVKVYRKPTHTDQYLYFNSHHPLEHKLTVVRTLTHRAQSVVTDERDRKEEITHVKKALKNCGYGEWTFLRAQSKNKKTYRIYWWGWHRKEILLCPPSFCWRCARNKWDELLTGLVWLLPSNHTGLSDKLLFHSRIKQRLKINREWFTNSAETVTHPISVNPVGNLGSVSLNTNPALQVQNQQ